jgi:hypothetical protein
MEKSVRRLRDGSPARSRQLWTTSGKSNGGTALKLIRLRTKQSSTTLKKQDGGTGSQRKLWRENVITVRTRTGHKGSGVRRTNGKCQPGEVNEKMRGARSVRRKEDPSMRDHFPKEEGK